MSSNTKERQSGTERSLWLGDASSLGSSEGVFRALAAHTPVGVFVSGADGSCEYVNDRWCELAGLTVEQALGSGWAKALHPEDVERVTAEWTEAAASGRDSTVEYRFLRPDGSVAWIEGFASAVRDEDGEVVGWVGTCLDLTARKASEEAAAHATERVKAAFDNAPCGMALVAPDGRWLQANEAFCRLLGYTEDQLCELGVVDVTHPDDRARSLDGASRDGRTEARFLRADGETVWVNVSTTVVRDGAGTPLYSVAQIEDVTDRLQTQRELEEAEERFRRAFDDAPIGMGLVSPEGRWLRANPSLCEIVGYDEAELLERTFEDITHPDDIEADLEQTRRLLAGEIRAYQLEKRYLRKGGDVVWIMLSVSLARTREGDPLYFVSQIEDITERKRAERELTFLAERDSLTGLFNRHRFHEELRAELARRARRPGRHAALLLLDIDRFKLVNDSLGHAAGDDVLSAVAETLRRQVRATDLVARLGGDEFAVLLLDLDELQDASRVATEIGTAISARPLATSGGPVDVTASIGVVLLDAHGAGSEEEVLVAADRAMYRAKQSGRDRIALAA